MPSVTLAWNDNSDNEDNFVLERKNVGGAFATIASPAANATLYTDNTVQPLSDYIYRIKATNTGGDSSYSNELSFNTLTVHALISHVGRMTRN